MKIEMKPKAVIVIFGATGDLAHRKLFPSIYRLYKNNEISEDFAVIGAARRPWTNEDLRSVVTKSIHDHVSADEQDIDEFTSRFHYLSFDVQESTSYTDLKQLIEQVEGEYNTEGNRVFFLSVAPQFFGTIATKLNDHGLKDGGGWNRLIVEKPFGEDLPSAIELNNEIQQSFDEDEVYRIDHYLGKEMVQNIETIRFANGMFEHLWNNKYISNIQVVSSESLGVEERAAFYDDAGAMRDMVQNHMFQMVALLAMEPPVSLSPDDIRAEKIRAFKSFRKLTGEDVHKHFVRGQYGPGQIDGKDLPGYREEDPILEESNTETLVAGRVLIDNQRWAGVPFYILTGKRMPKKQTKITVEFKDLPLNLYAKDGEKNPNLLVIQIQPDEGFELYLNAKQPDANDAAEPVKLSYYKGDHGISSPEAYQKLFLDAMKGDNSHFTHWEEVSHAWEYVDSILEVWNNEKANYPNYETGSMGPKEMDDLLAEDGNKWWPLD